MLSLAADLHCGLGEIEAMSSMEFELWRAFYVIRNSYQSESERRKGKLKFEDWAKTELEEDT